LSVGDEEIHLGFEPARVIEAAGGDADEVSRAFFGLAAGDAGAAVGALLPQTIGHRILLEIHATTGTFGRSIPFLDTMICGDGALRFETEPFEIPNALKRQAIQYCFERWRSRNGSLRRKDVLCAKSGAEVPLFQDVRNPKADHGVVEAFTIAAKNSLHGEIQASFRAARDFGAVTAFAAFKPIGATHSRPVKSFRRKQTRFFWFHVAVCAC
jgi:hypothetical protein